MKGKVLRKCNKGLSQALLPAHVPGHLGLILRSFGAKQKMLLERLGRCGCGSFNKTQGIIVRYTDSFTPAQVYTLRSVLLDRYGIESTRCAQNQAKEQYIIRIPKREVAKVQHLVKPHIPSIMAYRVGLSLFSVALIQGLSWGWGCQWPDYVLAGVAG